MANKERKNYEEEIEFPDGIQARIDNGILSIKGPKGDVKKDLKDPNVSVSCNANKISISSKSLKKDEKTVFGTFAAHIKSMVKGVKEGYVYKLKICSGHFPMTVSVSGSELSIKNFLGEKIPRILKLRQGVNVKVDGDHIVVESADKEIAGQTAADIEKLTIRKGFDTRIFQDGCYIIMKEGREIK